MAISQTIGFPPGYHRCQNILKMGLQWKTVLLHMPIYSLYQATAVRSASPIGKTEVVLLQPQGPKDEGN